MLHSLEQVKLEMLSMLNEICPQAFLTLNENPERKMYFSNNFLRFTAVYEKVHMGTPTNNHCLPVRYIKKGKQCENECMCY